MTDVTITYSDTGSKGRYVARVAGIDGDGVLTTSRVSNTLVIADHTGVSDSLRGLGVGKALVERLIEDARANGQRIMPLCPFVRAYAETHRAELTDVIQW